MFQSVRSILKTTQRASIFEKTEQEITLLREERTDFNDVESTLRIESPPSTERLEEIEKQRRGRSIWKLRSPGSLKGRGTGTRINTMLIKRGTPASRIEACCAQLLRMQTVEIRRRFPRSSCRLQSKNIWSMASGPDENVREKGRERGRERDHGSSMDSRVKSGWPNSRYLPTPRIYLANYFYLSGLLVRIQGQA